MKPTAIVTVCGALAWAAAASVAPADAVALKNRLVYDPAVITRVSAGFVTFKMGQTTLTKPLAEVAAITLSDNARFNEGEALLKAGKFAQAVAAYQAAERSASKPWQKALVVYRLLAAAEAAGQIDEAVSRWLKLVDADSAGAGSLKLRPTKLAPAKSPANDRAIAVLEAKAAKIKDKAYLREIYALLSDLYSRQGNVDKARALAAKLAGATKPPDNGNGPGPVVVPTNGGKHADLLRLARLSLQSKRYSAVVKQLEPKLKQFSAVELPDAMHLLGLARLQMAKGEKDAAERKPLLIRAGLDLMRVVVFHGGSEAAAPALLAAGEVNALLGNKAAAKKAYMLVLTKYGKSSVAAEAKKRVLALSEKIGE